MWILVTRCCVTDHPKLSGIKHQPVFFFFFLILTVSVNQEFGQKWLISFHGVWGLTWEDVKGKGLGSSEAPYHTCLGPGLGPLKGGLY